MSIAILNLITDLVASCLIKIEIFLFDELIGELGGGYWSTSICQ